MKRFLLLTLLLLITPISIVIAQTEIWSSDCESTVGWSNIDLDGDGQTWTTYSDGTYVGFNSGEYIGSLSLSLSPDNVKITPQFTIPTNASNITFSLKVASSSATDFQETFALYIQEIGVGSPYDNKLHEQTLSEGGPNSYSTVGVTIPDSFAGKTVNLVIRHYNTSDQFFFMVDDLLVAYNDALSTVDSIFENFSFYPNPVVDRLNFRTNLPISKVQIYNILGQSVLAFKDANLTSNGINISSLNRGTYLMQVTIDNVSQTFKLIKK